MTTQVHKTVGEEDCEDHKTSGGRGRRNITRQQEEEEYEDHSTGRGKGRSDSQHDGKIRRWQEEEEYEDHRTAIGRVL